MPLVYSVAGNDDALTICLDTGVGNPTLQGTLVGGGAPNYLNYADKIFVHGDYAYISTQIDTGLTIVNISDPTNPVFVSYLPLGTAMLDVYGGNGTVWENLIYITRQPDIFQVIDVSDPTNPTVIGTLAGSGPPNYLNSCRHMQVVGELVYIACASEDGLTILRVSDPYNPVYVGGYYEAAGPTAWMQGAASVVVRNNVAYVTSRFQDYLNAINVWNPLIPTVLGTLGVGWMGGPDGMELFPYSEYLFVLGAALDWLTAIDISNPAAMFRVAQMINGVGGNSFDGPADVAIEMNRAYVAASANTGTGNRMVVIDITDPLAPFQQGGIIGPGAPNYMRGCRGVALTSTYLPVVETQYATDIK